MNSLIAWWYSLPLGVRSAIVDSAETGAASALAIQWAVPATTDGWLHLAAAVLAAFAGATISALRRKAQAAIAQHQAGLGRE